MSTVPPSRSNTHATALPPDLAPLFIQQLSWLVANAQDTKATFTRWLLASPPPPSAPASLLTQARRITTRHLAQLTQLLPFLEWPLEPASLSAPSLLPLLEQGEACYRRAQSDAAQAAELMRILASVSTCFSAACTAAAETAIALRRVDLAAILASWAAAWRSLQDSSQSQSGSGHSAAA